MRILGLAFNLPATAAARATRTIIMCGICAGRTMRLHQRRTTRTQTVNGALPVAYNENKAVPGRWCRFSGMAGD